VRKTAWPHKAFAGHLRPYLGGWAASLSGQESVSAAPEDMTGPVAARLKGAWPLPWSRPRRGGDGGTMCRAARTRCAAPAAWRAGR
jgi:hypothetical protein